MAITSMDSLVAALAASPMFSFMAPSFTNAAGGFVNLQKASASSFGTLATPALNTAGGTLHTTAEAGFPKIGNVGVGNTRYLGMLSLLVGTVGSLLLFDRVWSCSGFSGALNTAQAVTSFPTLVRPDANGGGLEIWIECYGATGSTASNITVSYTNSGNVSGRTTVSTAHIASMPVNRMYRVPLQAGDTGVNSIQSVTLSASTATAGNFGVTLMKRLAFISAPIINLDNVKDFAALGLPVVQDNAALQFVHLATGTSSGLILGSMNLVED